MKRGKVWQVRVRAHNDPAAGKWKWAAATRDTKAAAEAAGRALLAEAEEMRRRWVEPTGETLRVFAEAWLERHTGRWRPRTVEERGP